MGNREQKHLERVVLGVDVGGTKIAASAVDARGNLLGRIQISTDISSPQATLSCIQNAVEQAISRSSLSRSDIQSVGLGIPGLVDPESGFGIASVNLGWRDVPVKAWLEERLGLPCHIENDVRAAAFGEARYGAGRGLDNMVFLIIGTGIMAVVIQGSCIYRGTNGLAGEIGHAILKRDGPRCKCGAHGCFEALATGPAIAARAVQKISEGRDSRLASHTGKGVFSLTAEQIFEAAAQGDDVALETIHEVAEDVAHLIQFLALAYDPQVIVLGGGVSLAGALFLNPVYRVLERMAEESWVFHRVYTSTLVQASRLGADIGVLGAAALAAQAVEGSRSV
jgi:glucokinase